MESENDEEKILNELNAHKKRHLDSAIYESFLHPKKIKTETLVLNQKLAPKKEVAKKDTKSDSSKIISNEKIKHKFKFE